RPAHRFPRQSLSRQPATACHCRRAAGNSYHPRMRRQGHHGRAPEHGWPRTDRWRTGIDRKIGLCLALPPALGRSSRPLAGKGTLNMQPTTDEPAGALTIRTLAMPADTNPAGDIFGGWVMSQMDIAGAIAAVERSQGRVVTVAVEAMTFIAPVKVGDILCVYTRIERVGTTSITIAIEAWARRQRLSDRVKVTDGRF